MELFMARRFHINAAASAVRHDKTLNFFNIVQASQDICTDTSHGDYTSQILKADRESVEIDIPLLFLYIFFINKFFCKSGCPAGELRPDLVSNGKLKE